MTSTRKTLAIYKVRPTSCKPIRPGPTQWMRPCNRCIYDPNEEHFANFEETVALKSYDNLVLRKFMWFPRYQSIQYHLGQIEILRKAINGKVPFTIYVVAMTTIKDSKFLDMVLDQVNIPLPRPIKRETLQNSDMIKLVEENKSILIPIHMRSCVSDGMSKVARDSDFLDAKDLSNFIRTGLNRISPDINVNIANLVITKDHDRLALFGLGSVCVQIAEPYTLYHYGYNLYGTTDKSTHLVQHIYHDAAKNAAIFPSHLVAFLILYLERDDGVNFKDLVEYMDWFRKISIDIDLHLGFTGETKNAVKAGLVILKDFIHTKSNELYRAKDMEKLMIYANRVVPFIAYYGIVATAIQIEHNKISDDPKTITMLMGNKIKVSQDDAIKTGEEIAQILELSVNCRKPCETAEDLIIRTIGQLQLCGKNIEIIEPQLYHDEEDNRNFDGLVINTWLIVSEKDYKRDRLNLLINAVSQFLI